ncbi:MAG: SRPBCC family protein [Acidimicrobiales bacterium]
MKIDNEFTVGVPIDTAWAVLTDLEGIAPCMPGAQLTGSEGDTYTGKVKIKVGPVTTEFTGTAVFSERDEARHRAVIDAKGRDARGSGNASATITAQLRAEGDHTVVSVGTDLKISGKLAQFGSSMIAEVSEKLLGQFVTCLESTLAGRSETPGPGPGPGAGASTSTSASANGAGEAGQRPLRVVRPTPEPEALDLLDLAGGAMYKRAIPVVVGAAVIVILVIYFRAR